MSNSRQIGKNYETKAVQYLETKGYRILERNFQVRQGEIDIVCLSPERDCFVFVEVKYRKNSAKGHPYASITLAKQKQICKTSLFYLNMHHINVHQVSVRYDVIGILGDEIFHLENAFPFV